MHRRFIVGPVGSLLIEYLGDKCRREDFLVFGPGAPADVVAGPGDRWEAIAAQLPSGWQPDFVLLDLAFERIPEGLWSAPLPLLGLVGTWDLHWHSGQRLWRRLDLVLTNSAGAMAMRRDGITQAIAAPETACHRVLAEPAPQAVKPRTLDVLYASREPLDRAVDRAILGRLAQLARLGDHRSVRIAAGLAEEEYGALLGRARIVVEWGQAGACCCGVWNAIACGALVFLESAERAQAAGLRDRYECVIHHESDLTALAEHYLEREEERMALAAAARARIPSRDSGTRMDQLLGSIEDNWPAIVERAARRSAERQTAHTLTSAGLSELAQAMADCQRVQPSALGGSGTELVEPARRALRLLDQPGPLDVAGWDPAPSASRFDPFFVEWQRDGWLHAGQKGARDDAQRSLLRWQLHSWLGRATGDLAHHYEAVVARPDLSVTRTALGIALAQANRPDEARHHLERAVAKDPFDLDAVRALKGLLENASDAHRRDRLARDRWLLAEAAPGLVPQEPWFADARPVGDELASIIILCCSQLHFTRLCLESVLCHTRAPYELVLVDNGSDDGTSDYLKKVAAGPGPARVEIIRNETNLGFPAGCNQALKRARGRYLVLLNNDTIVTDGWLGGLVAWSLHDWPRVGLVGAVSNAAAAPQQVEVDYQDPAVVGEFAARRGREFAGRALLVERLAGFCLLLRREVLEKVGGLDERYGLGFFDDDDLCVRAREAGFQLLLALNVFVHHFGSRTFAALGIDCRQQLEENFARFRAKWGPERSAGYHLALPVPGSTGGSRSGPAWAREPVRVQGLPAVTCEFADPGRVERAVAKPRPWVSLCLIVKNEEANLMDCLAGAGDLVDEVIVVDTGSTDRTRELAARAGARVYEFPWVDDFAAARNEALRHATGKWIFWLDADDRLDAAERHKLRALFADLSDENVAYAMKCFCPADTAPGTGVETVVDHIRLFRNDQRLRWKYRVHEQIMPSIRRLGVPVKWADITIRHIGYQDPTLRRAKLERDLRLLRLSLAEDPDEPFVLFNMGSVYLELGRTGEALPLFERSLERSHKTDSIVRKLYALVVQCRRRLAQPQEALKTCRAGREAYPEDAELLFQEGLILRGLGDLKGAETCLLTLLSSCEGDHFASVDPGLRGYKARHNLAVVYRDAGRTDQALAQWQAVTQERPDFPPAWLGLAELYLSLGRLSELEPVLARLEEQPTHAEEAALLRARSLLKQQEFSRARGILEGVIGRSPGSIKPRVILSHVLLQEGRDPAAAERALREVLALDPVNVEARHNLAVLMSRSSRSAWRPDPAEDSRVP